MTNTRIDQSIPISILRSGGVVEITMAPQGHRNALDAVWGDAMLGALKSLQSQDRCILLRSGASDFCVGADVKQFSGGERPEIVEALARQLNEVILLLVESPIPVVSAARGWTVGGGLGLALAADILIVGESVRFKAAYDRLGFTLDGGLSWLLPRRATPALAKDLLLSGRVWDSDFLLAHGLVSRRVSDRKLDEAARGAATLIAESSAPAINDVRRLLSQAASASLVDQLDAEVRSMRAAVERSDGVEGVTAFLEKRDPVFAKGRPNAVRDVP